MQIGSKIRTVEPEPGHIRVRHASGRVEPRENVPYLDDVFSNNAARVVIFLEMSSARGATTILSE